MKPRDNFEGEEGQYSVHQCNLAALSPRRALKMSGVKRTFLLVMGLVVLLTVFAGWQFSLGVRQEFAAVTKVMDALVAGRYNLLQAAPFEIQPGMDLKAREIIERLRALGYVRARSTTVQRGEFFISGSHIYIASRDFEQRLPITVRIDLDGPLVSTITDLGKKEVIHSLALEPCILTRYTKSIWELREPVAYRDIPANLIKTITCVDDSSLFKNEYAQLVGLMKNAVWGLISLSTTRSESVSSLVMAFLLDQTGQPPLGKVSESFMEMLLCHHYSREDLLLVYVNNVPLGEAGQYTIHGFAAAARVQFGKEIKQLTPAECAKLAVRAGIRTVGVPQQQITATLSGMKRIDLGFSASTTAPTFTSNFIIDNRDSMAHYLQRVDRELTLRRSTSPFYLKPMTITVALDPWTQVATVRTLRAKLAELDAKRGAAGQAKPMQGAVIIIDPQDGGIKTMVGGREFQEGTDRVFTARPAGSIITPFITLTSLAGTLQQTPVTPSTLIQDAPLAITVNGKKWSFKDPDETYQGAITVREALITSRLTPTVKLGVDSGLEQLAIFLEDAGVADNLKPTPDITTGAFNVTPAGVAAGYALLANGGSMIQPTVFTSIGDDGMPGRKSPLQERLLPAPACFVMTDLLKSSLAVHSEEKGPNSLILTSAGQSGTSTNREDAWFAGYTHDQVTVVWVGRDDGIRMGLTGAMAAQPVWQRLHEMVAGSSRTNTFPVPPGVVFASIDPATGRLAGYTCPKPVRVAFVKGTEPTETGYTLWDVITGSSNKTTTPEAGIGETRQPSSNPDHPLADWFNNVESRARKFVRNTLHL